MRHARCFLVPGTVAVAPGPHRGVDFLNFPLSCCSLYVQGVILQCVVSTRVKRARSAFGDLRCGATCASDEAASNGNNRGASSGMTTMWHLTGEKWPSGSSQRSSLTTRNSEEMFGRSLARGWCVTTLKNRTVTATSWSKSSAGSSFRLTTRTIRPRGLPPLKHKTSWRAYERCRRAISSPGDGVPRKGRQLDGSRKPIEVGGNYALRELCDRQILASPRCCPSAGILSSSCG